MIWLSLIIPIIFSIVLIIKYKHALVWWELCLPMSITFVFIVVMKLLCGTLDLTTEYHGSIIKEARYFEDWNEYIHRTCTKSCGKNCTYTVDCSYVLYHPEYWEVLTTTNETIRISEHEYNKMKLRFRNNTFVELRRGYYTNDGDEYVSVWNGDSITAVPATTDHFYHNKIKVADKSIFHFKDVDESDIKKYDLKEYPKITQYLQPAVIGESTTEATNAHYIIDYANGKLGPIKKVKIFLLLFHNQPIEAGLYQESYWKGGNLNEFIVSININDSRQVQWCRVTSWTRNEELKLKVRDFVEQQDTLNLISTSRYIHSEVEKGFEVRESSEFEYLHIEPPTWLIILTFSITIIINIIISFIVINNNHY